MNVDEDDIKHRWLGRLVYLFYFDKVEVDTYFEKTKLPKTAVFKPGRQDWQFIYQ